MQVVVTGGVAFESGAIPFADAIAYISLLDVSRQDAPSRIIAREVIKGLKYSAGMEIKFSLSGETDDPNGTYAVSAHIDVDKDGEVSVGDYLTTGFYPVSLQDRTAQMHVIVQRVES